MTGVAGAARNAVSICGVLILAGCSLPGKPKPSAVIPRPQAVTSFEVLYAQNCSGCHGTDGKNGAATELANPQYLALVDDPTLHGIVANGQPGTLMPGFAASGGGDLTNQQVDVLVQGMRARWSGARPGGNPNGALAGVHAPPYHAAEAGDAKQGEAVYAAACARCHGASAQHSGPAGSILDGSFLGLIDAQTIRTTIIAGRPDTGHPDWRGVEPGHPLTGQEITDLTAWMMSRKPAHPGQPYYQRVPSGASATLESGGSSPGDQAKSQP